MALSKRSAPASVILMLSLFATACGGGSDPVTSTDAAVGTVPPNVPLTVAPMTDLPDEGEPASEALAFQDPSTPDTQDDSAARAEQEALDAERAEKVAAAKAQLAAEREQAAADLAEQIANGELVGEQPQATTEQLDEEQTQQTQTEDQQAEQDVLDGEQESADDSPATGVAEVVPLASFGLEAGVVVSASTDAPAAGVIERRDSWLASLAEEDRQSISTLHILPAADPSENAEPWVVVPEAGFNTVYLRLQ